VRLIDDLAHAAKALGTTLRRAMRSPATPGAALSFRGHPVLRSERCTRCQTCVEACPTMCIHIYGADNTAAELDLDWQRCMCCGICAQVCPENAIELCTEMSVVTSALSTLEEQEA
jgi:formate hydrogenlyase subunit 6/NADH:ubiquinone oxidoreductase subunit I